MNNILPSVKKIQQSQLCVVLNVSILHKTTSQSNSWLLCYSLIDLQLCNFHNHSKVALQTNAWVSKCPFQSQHERRSLKINISRRVCVDAICSRYAHKVKSQMMTFITFQQEKMWNVPTISRNYRNGRMNPACRWAAVAGNTVCRHKSQKPS